MKITNLLLCILCSLLVIALNVGLNIPLRIAIGIDGVAILANAAYTIWRWHNGKTQDKDVERG